MTSGNYAQSTIDVSLTSDSAGGRSLTGTYATTNGITGQVQGTLAGTMESGTFSGTLSYLTSPLGGTNCNGTGAFSGTLDAAVGIKWTSPGFRSNCPGDPTTVEVKAPPGGSGPTPTRCTYVLSVGPEIDGHPNGLTFPVSLKTGGECAWTANTDASWIHLPPSASGSGPATLMLNVDANTGAARTGTFTIGFQTVTFNQSASGACAYTLSIGSLITGYPDGGSFSVTVTTAAGCVWTAAANEPWIHLAAPSGAGVGALTFTVDPNPGAPRTGTLTIAGQTVTFSQGSQCSYTVSPTSLNASPTGGSLSVTVAAGSACAWTAASNVPFIHVTAGAAGTGNGTATFTVDANSGSPRTGTLTIADQTVTVTQGPPCTYTLSTSAVSASRDGGPFTFNVTAGSGCAWTAVSNAPYIRITTAAGTGNGTVTFSVDPNTTSNARSDSIVVSWAGGSAQVTVNQEGPLPLPAPPPAPPPTPTFSRCDFNHDNVIDGADVAIIRQVVATGSQDRTYDLNRDGKVDLTDLQIEVNATRNPSACPP